MSRLLFLIPIICFLTNVQSQSTDAYVDPQGVLRWGKTDEEIHAFGVNYTAPFAYAYRIAKQQNISLEQAIDNDVYHFARLGFDAYRVHVWDCEISDTLGNLLENEHLRLFDYTIKKMKERGMHFVLTPIAWWGNGWPAPDEKTPGFSRKYGKDDCLVNPEAIKAQENYLYQFLNHVNTYTGLAYKDDLDVIAFEVCNEPHHKEAPEQVTAFINRMIASMRHMGCKKPVLYNISHRVQLADAYFKSDLQGGTFQWYPTGLGARHTVQGNLLPNVDHYPIPFAKDPRFQKEAKIVYEFDAADVGATYMYPAMARSFREAGIQLATHFAYDPTYMAASNTEYGTHYMNLVYAPQKALSLKIASEVFHTVPRYKSFGSFPTDTVFDVFRVSYLENLAEMVSAKKFLYTNNTHSVPPVAKDLEEIAGFGNSPLVQYEGSGAYFLDRVETGVWRLEVLPDAVWVRDPFEKTTLDKAVSVINWRSWPMHLVLPDLGENFSIKPLNTGNSNTPDVKAGLFFISPGAYLLVKNGVSTKRNGEDHLKNISLKEFVAPTATLQTTYVLHEPAPELSEGTAYTVKATIISPDAPESVELVLGEGYRAPGFKMEKVQGYTYAATIPATMIREGFLKYFIVVQQKGSRQCFPSGGTKHPADWDFFAEQAYTLRIVSPQNPLYLFDAINDADGMERQWTRGSALVPLPEPGKAELQVHVNQLFVPDDENPNGEKHYDYSFRYCFAKKIMGRRIDLASKKALVLHGRSMTGKPCTLQLALITKSGAAYAGIITVGTEAGEYRLALSDLKPVKLVSLPRPYPTFLPYFVGSDAADVLDLNTVETLQFSIGPGIPAGELEGKFGVALRDVRLE